jgi:hypothetical protein
MAELVFRKPLAKSVERKGGMTSLCIGEKYKEFLASEPDYYVAFPETRLNG